MLDLIIIGAGPAGLCASVYAARKQLKTMLISLDLGGQVNFTRGVENYLGYQFIEGSELIDKFEAQVKQFPIERRIGHRVTGLKAIEGGFEVSTASSERHQSKTVILATGKKPKKLDIPGEAEYMGKGVTYCAICDGPVFAGQKVAIIGGGNSAVSAAIDMLKIAEYVHIVSSTPFTADPILVNQLAGAQKMSRYLEHRVVRIEGREFVNGLVIKNNASGEETRLEVAGVFVEIGLTPNSEVVKGLIELNRQGEVPVSCYSETTLPGFFAAGDVTDVPEKQIIIAAGEGAKAALEVHRFLQRQAQ